MQVINNTPKRKFIPVEASIQKIEDAIHDYEKSPKKQNYIHDLAYLYWLRGIKENRHEDWLKARALGIECLAEEEIFTLEFLHTDTLDWKLEDNFWDTTSSCSRYPETNLLDLPVTEKYLSCTTWVVLSWTKLIEYYHMPRGALDAIRVLYLASWLFAHRSCLDTPWLRYAIGTAQLHAYRDPRSPFGAEKLHRLGKETLQDLWSEGMIGKYAFLDYLIFLLETDSVPQEERAEIYQRLEELGEDPLFEEMVMQLRRELEELK